MAEAVMPGIGEMCERSMYANAWARAARSAGVELQYGTPEFSRALEEAAAQTPGFDKTANGLHPNERIFRSYSVLAKAIAGKATAKPASKPVQGNDDELEAYIASENSRSSFSRFRL